MVHRVPYNKNGSRSFYQIGTLVSIIGDGRNDIKKQQQRNGARRIQLKKIIEGRDGKTCFYCGETKKLELDHIVPLFAGGDWELENLQLLCHECHVKKTIRIDRAFVQFAQKVIERTLHNLDKLLIDDPDLPYPDTV